MEGKNITGSASVLCGRDWLPILNFIYNPETFVVKFLVVVQNFGMHSKAIAIKILFFSLTKKIRKHRYRNSIKPMKFSYDISEFWKFFFH